VTCSPDQLETSARAEGEHLVLADILMLVPACIAGIGGALLGDKLGLWIKGALADRGSR
jgi:hypothetical protein